ncbi:MAG: glycoside hydrolase family 31 protein [Clostridia bacterium]|nr:glycoside hydrolase family 31 protein [Clostridia bacterium]
MQKKIINDKITRIFERNDSMLTRYHILNDGDAEAMSFDSNSAVFAAGKRELSISFTKKGKGFEVRIPLSAKERIFGGGDATKKSVMHRGHTLVMDTKNIVCYGPIPFFMSSDGWAILMNCTYCHSYDIGETEPDTMIITAQEGTLDFYIFCGDNFAELLKSYTDISGKPMVLPKIAYGFTMCENDQCTAYSLLETCKNFREHDIPCDIISLEPGWMETYYDYTTEKKWDPTRFYLPYWKEPNQSGERTFFFPMREMGMNLSLWLCENYDLFYEEEGNTQEARDTGFGEDAQIADVHLTSAKSLDTITKVGEPWFEHLKKFVDNGAVGFKLDGADQLLYHTDRLWAGKFSDKEVHNAYPIVLAKQMEQGFREHTDRRPFMFTADCYAGIQQYAASWTGDIGGGPRTIPAIFNYAMCAHSNTSCDMGFLNAGQIHYGFLLPYSQFNNWSQWHYPWFLAKEREDMIRTYSKLRSSLFPYIYTMAHEAHRSGMPVARPLPLIYEDTDRFDEVRNLYMLGENLLVGVFDMHFDLPEGVWVDYITGKEYEGTIDYEIPEGMGGALFVRKGSVLFTMQPQKYLLEKEHDYILRVYPGADCEGRMIEDDGWSYDYEEGKVAETRVAIENSAADGFTLVLDKRVGGFDGKPDNGHDHRGNSIPKISGMQPIRDITVKIAGKEPKSISIDGKEQAFTYEDGYTLFTVLAKDHEMKNLNYQVRY